jgi:hypothetical protein
MRLSPLHLQFYFVQSLRFALKPGFDQEFKAEAIEASSPRLMVNVHAERDADDPLGWHCNLSIETNDDTAQDFPYTFGVALTGSFHVDENIRRRTPRCLPALTRRPSYIQPRESCWLP